MLENFSRIRFFSEFCYLQSVVEINILLCFFVVGEPVEVHQPIYRENYSVIVRTRRIEALSADSYLKETAVYFA